MKKRFSTQKIFKHALLRLQDANSQYHYRKYPNIAEHLVLKMDYWILLKWKNMLPQYNAFKGGLHLMSVLFF